MTRYSTSTAGKQSLSLIFLIFSGCSTVAGLESHDSAIVAAEPSSLITGGQQDVPFLYRPTAVAFGPHDNLFILDSGNHQVVVVGPDGNLRATVGGPGEGPGEFSFWGAGGRLAVGDEAFVVLESSRNRVSVFNLEGGLLHTFQTEVSAQGIAIRASSLYVTVVEGASSKVNEYDLSGRLKAKLPGVKTSPAREQGAASRFLQLSYVAVDQDNSVWHAFRAWPLLRRYAGGTVEEQWMDFAWLGDATSAAQYARPRELLAEPFEDSMPAQLRKSVSFDIDCSADGVCAVALALGIVQGFDLTGRPLKAHRLWRDPETGFYPTRDIALTRDGRTLCAADSDSAAVRCYAGLSWLEGQ